MANDLMREVIKRDASPPLAAMGADNHQIVISVPGLRQDFVHRESVAYLGLGMKAKRRGSGDGSGLG